MSKGPHTAVELAKARFPGPPADTTKGQLADRACLALRLGGMLRASLQQALAAPPEGALRHQRMRGSCNLPGCSAERAPSQFLGPGGVAGTAAALRAKPCPWDPAVPWRHGAWHGPRPHRPEVVQPLRRGRAPENRAHGLLLGRHLVDLGLEKPLARRKGFSTFSCCMPACSRQGPGSTRSRPFSLLALGPKSSGHGRCPPPPFFDGSPFGRAGAGLEPGKLDCGNRASNLLRLLLVPPVSGQH